MAFRPQDIVTRWVIETDEGKRNIRELEDAQDKASRQISASADRADRAYRQHEAAAGRAAKATQRINKAALDTSRGGLRGLEKGFSLAAASGATMQTTLSGAIREIILTGTSLGAMGFIIAGVGTAIGTLVNRFNQQEEAAKSAAEALKKAAREQEEAARSTIDEMEERIRQETILLRLIQEQGLERAAQLLPGEIAREDLQDAARKLELVEGHIRDAERGLEERLAEIRQRSSREALQGPLFSTRPALLPDERAEIEARKEDIKRLGARREELARAAALARAREANEQRLLDILDAQGRVTKEQEEQDRAAVETHEKLLELLERRVQAQRQLALESAAAGFSADPEPPPVSRAEADSAAAFRAINRSLDERIALLSEEDAHARELLQLDFARDAAVAKILENEKLSADAKQLLIDKTRELFDLERERATAPPEPPDLPDPDAVDPRALRAEQFAAAAAATVQTSLSDAIYDGIFEGFDNAGDILENFGRRMTQILIDAVIEATIGEAIRGAMSSIFGTIFKLPSIPAAQFGGLYTKPTLLRITEHEPERVVREREYQGLLRAVREGRGGGGDTVVVQIPEEVTELGFREEIFDDFRSRAMQPRTITELKARR